MKKTGRWALRSLVAGTSAVALAAALTAQAGAATTWTIHQRVTSVLSIQDVAVSPGGSVWSTGHKSVSGVGNVPVVQHLVNDKFQSVTLPSTWRGTWSEIDASSSKNVWAFGANSSETDLAAQWNGTAWRGFTLPTGARVTDSKVISASDVWTVSDATTARRWNGTAWSTKTLPIRANAVDGTSAANVWVAGMRRDADDVAQPGAALWNGSTWTDISPDGVATDGRSSAYFTDLTVISPTNVWAVGSYNWMDAEQNDHTQPLLAHYTGGKWYVWKQPEGSAYDSVVHDGHGGIHIMYGSGNPTVLHGRNGVWTRIALPHLAGYTVTAMNLELNPATGTIWTSGWHWVTGDPDAQGIPTYWRRLGE